MNENVKGNLSISQIATGQENNFSISIYGEKGALHWSQENPNYARFSKSGYADQIITRGGAIQNEELKYNGMCYFRRIVEKNEDIIEESICVKML